MQKYIDQLTTDLRALQDKWKADTDPLITAVIESGDETEDMFAEVERFVRGPAPSASSLATTLGIDLGALPPLSRLDDSQVAQLTRALRGVLNAVGHYFHAPEGFPDRSLYPILLDTLREPLPVMRHGSYNHDGCGGEPSDCWWGEYCACLKLRDEPLDLGDFLTEAP